MYWRIEKHVKSILVTFKGKFHVNRQDLILLDDSNNDEVPNIVASIEEIEVDNKVIYCLWLDANPPSKTIDRAERMIFEDLEDAKAKAVAEVRF